MSSKEAIKRAQTKYASNNKEVISKRHRHYRDTHPEYFLWKSARQRARDRNLPFELEVSDISIPEVCPILQIPLKLNSGRPGGKADSPSVDRIIPSLGYIKNNIQVISFKANMMKSDASISELLLFKEWIRKTYE